MSLRSLIILGTGGLARELALLAQNLNAVQHRWELLGFVGPPGCAVGALLGGLPILGDDLWLLQNQIEADLVIGVGYPSIRAGILEGYLQHGERFKYPNLIHPSVKTNLNRVEMGIGNIFTAGCFISCDVRVSDFNLFNWNVTVGHDANIGSFNVINPGSSISGGVCIGDQVLVGTGARVLENLTIGSNARVGAGAVVTRSVAAGVTVFGAPAKPSQGTT
jgi:sugar O-acyltransferase (sialic acid O-acetyltransferase NeuD family)